jgi:hypothetical protein
MENFDKNNLQQEFEADAQGLYLVDGRPFLAKDADFESSFTDEFNGKGPWALGNSPSFEARMEDSAYYFEHKLDAQAFYSYVPMAIKADKNWAIEASIEALSIKEGNGFGLVVGKNQQSHGGSVFFINPLEKRFWIAHHNGEQWYNEINGHLFRLMEEKNNILRVENIEGHWQFFINSYLVYICPTQALYGDAFGFAFHRQATIRADYFKIQW